MIPKMKSLKDKLEQEAKLQKELVKVRDEIDEETSEKKVKIKRTSLKGSKNPKKG